MPNAACRAKLNLSNQLKLNVLLLMYLIHQLGLAHEKCDV